MNCRGESGYSKVTTFFLMWPTSLLPGMFDFGQCLTVIKTKRDKHYLFPVEYRPIKTCSETSILKAFQLFTYPSSFNYQSKEKEKSLILGNNSIFLRDRLSYGNYKAMNKRTFHISLQAGFKRRLLLSCLSYGGHTSVYLIFDKGNIALCPNQCQ